MITPCCPICQLPYNAGPHQYQCLQWESVLVRLQAVEQFIGDFVQAGGTLEGLAELNRQREGQITITFKT